MQSDIFNEYSFEDHSTINLSSIGKTIKSFIVTRKDTDSLGSNNLESEYNSDQNQEYNSDKKGDQSKLTDRIEEESDEEDSDEKRSN